MEHRIEDFCFVLNPPSGKYHISVRPHGSPSTAEPFCMRPEPNGMICLVAFDNADYDIEVSSTHSTPPVPLHKCAITKTADGVTIKAMDTLATAIEAVFLKADAPFGGAEVTGSFTANSGKQSQIKGNTDTEGRFNIVLPAGVVDNLVAQKGTLRVTFSFHNTNTNHNLMPSSPAHPGRQAGSN